MRSVTRHLALVIALGLLVAACGSGPTVTPSPAPGGQPTAVIESPVNGAPTPIGQALTVQVRADDLAVGVNRIDLLVGGILVDIESTPGDVPQPMFTVGLQWTPTAEGSHTLTAIAFRPDGTASQPAEVTVAVVLPSVSLPPTAAPTAGGMATPTPTAAGPSPTAAARPTLPPFATPSPSPSPTPSPTATPTPLDLGVFVNDFALPAIWYVDTEYQIDTFVTNYGPGQAPPADIRVRLCALEGPCGDGGSGSTQSSPLDPNTTLDYPVTITPTLTGDRILRVRVIVPDGYADPDPSNNQWTFQVIINPLP